jgi:hypothetical protein
MSGSGPGKRTSTTMPQSWEWSVWDPDVIFLKRLHSIYRRKSVLPGWLTLLLILLSLLNTGRIFQSSLQPERPIDFRSLYLGQYLLQKGENPYDYRLVIQTWKEIAERESLNTNSIPRFLLYPPWALALFLIFAPFPFRTAVWIWYAALPIMLIAIIYWCMKFFLPSPSWINFVEASLFVLAFKGTIQSMTVGQPAFPCLALGFGSLVLYKGKRNLWAGLLLALSALKISLAVPFVLFFLFRRSFSVLFTASVTGGLLCTVWFILTDNPIEVATGFLHAIGVVDSYSFRQSRLSYPRTYDMINKTEIGALLEYLFNGIAPYLPLIYLCLVIVIALFCFRHLKGREPTDLFLFLLLALLALLTTHHFYYDCLILLPLYFLALELKPGHRGVLLFSLLPLFIPVNGLLNRLPTPAVLDILYFHVPMTVAAVIAFVLWRLAEHDGALIVPQK